MRQDKLAADSNRRWPMPSRSPSAATTRCSNRYVMLSLLDGSGGAVRPL